MATILLSAAGAAIGSGFGGSVLGLSGAVIGRSLGGIVGQAIDRRVLGQGSEPVAVGRLSRYRISGAQEGAAVPLAYGRTRVAGQVIWATRFRERVDRDRVGGKGGGGGTVTESYSYSVSLALALGEGPALAVGRIWADGIEIAPEDLDLRFYDGGPGQLPDPLIEAVEGAGRAPAYRGTAYIVIEDLELAEFGNRVPQINVEVIRPTEVARVPFDARSLSRVVRGIALMPGTGEYALATRRVGVTEGLGRTRIVNMSASRRRTDIEVSLDQLRTEVPACRAGLLIVSWFGSDLRAGACEIRPKVEQKDTDSDDMPWWVSGTSRAAARVLGQIDGRPVYGGTPADASVVEAIGALKARGQHVTYYPFILMEQLAGNTLTDPWTGGTGQAVLPWRGRITTSLAPGVPGSPDRTAAAEDEVAAFFGQADPGDFAIVPAPGGGVRVDYSGPQDWRYRRYILHQAWLCKAAGGVDAFCIGSEMRALTQIRGAGDSFPAVAEMVRLARDVRSVLGPGTKIGYAADWSEYFGYQPADGSGDVYFHLDPLWADADIDFIGIDNYMPLTDWREGVDHRDARDGVTSIYDPAYLRAGVAGGEGYDWFYPDQAARDAQDRVAITDGAYGEPWVFRYKDLRGWWENAHFERRGGVRLATPTAWQPRSKPFWFTEYGCAAIDKGTNQPNKFLDPKSSESRLPYYSTGARDEFLQGQYLRAVSSHWEDPANNPVSPVYGGAMVDVTKFHVWAWDARPYPQFPARRDLWSDGANYDRGHWINGRVSHEALAAVVADLCDRAGTGPVDVSRVWGLVRGYEADLGAGLRGALQPLMLAYGMEAAEREGSLRFSMRDGRPAAEVAAQAVVAGEGDTADVEYTRAPLSETPNRVRLGYVRAGSDYPLAATEASFPDAGPERPAASEVALVLTDGEARGVADRWLAEGRVARDGVRFALPPSRMALGAGDVVALPDGGLYRLDRSDLGAGQELQGVRVEAGAYVAAIAEELPVAVAEPVAPVPVRPVFLDLPLLTGAEVPHAPHLAVAAEPWPGPVAVYSASGDAGYALDTVIGAPATVGVTLDPLPAADPARWDRGAAVRVQVSTGGPLASVEAGALLAGANAFAIGDGSAEGWEVFQAAQAELVGPDTWALSMRLRGQLGTEGEMRAPWPAGSLVVALDGSPQQVALPPAARGVARNYRIGAVDLPLGDPALVHVEAAFAGVGLRPYAPVHLRLREVAGALEVGWTRRTRIDGDSWAGLDVPLGEEGERYVVRVLDGAGAVLRTAEVTLPGWTYTAAARAADGAAGRAVEVAQLSAQFGAGSTGRIEIDG